MSASTRRRRTGPSSRLPASRRPRRARRTAMDWASGGARDPRWSAAITPFLRGNGGDYFDPKTWEIHINNDKAVEALQYYGDLMTKHKVVVPDCQ